MKALIFRFPNDPVGYVVRDLPADGSRPTGWVRAIRGIHEDEPVRINADKAYVIEEVEL